MRDLIGLVASYAYFFGLLFCARFIRSSVEAFRKFVHIMLGNWWFIVIVFFSSVWTAIIVPFSFIFINLFSLKRNKDGGLLSELERKTGQKSFGIVAYPIAMCMLVFLSFYVFKQPYIGGIGLLSLSYGDGFAALIGTRFPIYKYHIWGNVKSIGGSAGMFVCTFLVTLLYLIIIHINIPYAVTVPILLISAFSATFVEAFTPFGLDNITVPIVSTIVYFASTKLCF